MNLSYIFLSRLLQKAESFTLTFQTLVINHSAGSFSHCMMQSITAHLVEPARAQSSFLFIRAKGLNQGVNLEKEKKNMTSLCACLFQKKACFSHTFSL